LMFSCLAPNFALISVFKQGSSLFIFLEFL
jgi:hypothetical protein